MNSKQELKEKSNRKIYKESTHDLIIGLFGVMCVIVLLCSDIIIN